MEKPIHLGSLWLLIENGIDYFHLNIMDPVCFGQKNELRCISGNGVIDMNSPEQVEILLNIDESRKIVF